MSSIGRVHRCPRSFVERPRARGRLLSDPPPRSRRRCRCAPESTRPRSSSTSPSPRAPSAPLARASRSRSARSAWSVQVKHRFGVPATVLDVGANKGQFSRAAATAFPGARIIAFEPLEAVAAEWRRHLADVATAEIHVCALGAEDGTVTFHPHEYTLSSSVLPLAAGAGAEGGGGAGELAAVEVPVRRLDDVVTLDDLRPRCWPSSTCRATSSRSCAGRRRRCAMSTPSWSSSPSSAITKGSRCSPRCSTTSAHRGSPSTCPSTCGATSRHGRRDGRPLPACPLTWTRCAPSTWSRRSTTTWVGRSTPRSPSPPTSGAHADVETELASTEQPGDDHAYLARMAPDVPVHCFAAVLAHRPLPVEGPRPVAGRVGRDVRPRAPARGVPRTGAGTSGGPAASAGVPLPAPAPRPARPVRPGQAPAPEAAVRPRGGPPLGGGCRRRGVHHRPRGRAPGHLRRRCPHRGGARCPSRAPDRATASGFRARHGIPADATVVLFLSRLDVKKGLDLLTGRRWPTSMPGWSWPVPATPRWPPRSTGRLPAPT